MMLNLKAMAETMVLSSVRDALGGDARAEEWLNDADQSEHWFDMAGVSHPRFTRLWRGSRDIALARYRARQIQMVDHAGVLA